MKSGASTLRNWLVSSKPIRAHFDYWLFFSIAALVFVGLIMVYSSSYIFSFERTGDGLYFVKRQILFVGFGMALLWAAHLIPTDWWRKSAYWVLLFAVFLTLLVLIPGVGVKVGGAQRWLRLGVFSFQPVEFLKLAIVVFVARQLAHKADRIHTFKGGVLPCLFLPIPILSLLLLQPDFGSVMILLSVIIAMMFLGGVRLAHLAGLGAIAGVVSSWLLLSSPYRMARVLSFLDPWADPSGKGFQVIQSLVGISNGGLIGVGLGNGKEKLFFLPEAHNDFIFSVVGEELGALGVLGLISGFCWIVYRGLKTGWKLHTQQSDRFGYLLVSGLTLLVGLQAFINMAVTFGLVPTKGLSLPLISYGGSSTMMTLVVLGVILGAGSKR